MDQPIAFVCAMPMELRPLTKRLGLRRHDIAGMPARVGSLDGRDVVAIVTGMGTDLATRGTDRLLAVTAPQRVVVVGITGAVENETPIGTLVLPEVVVNSETGSEHRPTQIGDVEHRGTMWTTNVITPPDALPSLRARGVVALDMETAAIAASCERRGIPWSVFRAISDRASDGTIDDEIFGLSHQDGTPNVRAIAHFVLRHPNRIPRMASLARGAKLATERAAEAAIEAVRATR